MNQKVTSPFNARDIKLDFDQIETYWFDNDPFKSRFFDALSTLFPDGERFFIETARVYRDQVTDPKLKAELAAFVRQEGHHGKLHAKYNHHLQQQGLNTEAIFERNRKILGRYKRWLSPKSALAITCALEHLTAIMGQRFMENMEMFDSADEILRALYFWHGVEEIEHKAVCYDLYTQVAKGGYVRRVLLQMFISMMFVRGTLLVTYRMLAHDGQNTLDNWKRGMQWLWGKKGIMRPLLKDYLQYFKPGFHPNDLQPPESWQQWIDAYEQDPNPVSVSMHIWKKKQAQQLKVA
jgi:predicted metal-dependent hydrolase